MPVLARQGRRGDGEHRHLARHPVRHQPGERQLVSRLDAVARDAAEAGLVAPVVFIIGRVVAACRPWSSAWMAALETGVRLHA